MNVALVLSQSPHPSRAPLVGNAADPSSPPAVALQNRQVGPSCVAAVPVLILGIFQSTVLRRYRRRFYEYPIAASDVEAPQPEPTDVALDDGDDDDDDAASPTGAAVFRQKLAHPFRKLSRPLDKVLASLDDAGDATDDGLDSRPSAIDPLDRRLRAIAPRQDLDRRFGHPALDAPLWTTMVFKRHEALLPQVYQGRGVAQTSVSLAALLASRNRPRAHDAHSHTLPPPSADRGVGARQPAQADRQGRRRRDRPSRGRRPGSRSGWGRGGGCARAGQDGADDGCALSCAARAGNGVRDDDKDP